MTPAEGEGCPRVASICAASPHSSSRTLELRLKSTCGLTLLPARAREDAHEKHTRARVSLFSSRAGEGAAMRQQATPSPSPGRRLTNDVMTTRVYTFT